MLFLWNVGSTETSREVTLEFYDSSKGKLEKINVDNYQPYFLTRYPLSKEEEAAVASVEGQVEQVTKQNLFTEEKMQLARIKAWTPAFLKKLVRQFDDVWEGDRFRSCVR